MRHVLFTATSNCPFPSFASQPDAAAADGGGGGEDSQGLNFNVTPEQQEYLDLATQFTKNEIIPVAAHYDTTGEFPWAVLKKAHETGLMNLHIPQEYGGMGLGTLDGCLITVSTTAFCSFSALLLSSLFLPCSRLQEFSDLRRRWPTAVPAS